jgi:hypothetical protein
VALKSILDIDIDDSKFQRFKDQFDRYTELLKKQPEIWKRISGMHQQHAAQMGELAKTMTKMSQLRQKAVNDSQAEGKQLEHSSRLWTSIRRNAQDVNTSIETGARGLMKWATLLGGIGAGLLGVGGLLGFSSLAGSISGQRRTATGLGMSIGEQQAFGINFGRFVDTDSFMNWVSGMQQDISKQAPAMALLHHPLSGTSADYLQMLDAVRAFARSPRFAGARGLGLMGPVMQQGFGLNLSDDDRRRLRDMSDTEWNAQRSQYFRDAQRLNVPDRGAMAFQNFTSQMERAAQQMRASLGPALEGLTGPLSKLSEGIANALGAFLKTDAVKEGISSLASGLNSLGDYLGSDSFKSDMRAFADNLHEIVQGFQHPLSSAGSYIWRHSLFGSEGPIAGVWGAARPWLAPDKDWANKNPDAYMARLDQHFGLGSMSLELFRKLENSKATDVSRAGARGVFQDMPDMPGGKFSFDPTDFSESANYTAKLVSDLMRRFHGDAMSVLAAYNYGSGNVEALQKKWGTGWYSHLPMETQNYVGRGMIIVQVNNNTGGSATASVSALGATP